MGAVFVARRFAGQPGVFLSSLQLRPEPRMAACSSAAPGGANSGDRSDVSYDQRRDDDEGWAIDTGAVALAWLLAIALFVGFAKSGGVIGWLHRTSIHMLNRSGGSVCDADHKVGEFFRVDSGWC